MKKSLFLKKGRYEKSVCREVLLFRFGCEGKAALGKVIPACPFVCRQMRGGCGLRPFMAHKTVRNACAPALGVWSGIPQGERSFSSGFRILARYLRFPAKRRTIPVRVSGSFQAKRGGALKICGNPVYKADAFAL